jgi:hypothetical protein
MVAQSPVNESPIPPEGATRSEFSDPTAVKDDRSQLPGPHQVRDKVTASFVAEHLSGGAPIGGQGGG